MITDVNELIRVCLEELVDRQYKPDYIRLLTEHWNTLSQWMEANSLTVFSSTTAERYCDLHIGSHILTDRGVEFGKPQDLETGIKGVERTSIYFCDPMRSCQKGYDKKSVM